VAIIISFENHQILPFATMLVLSEKSTALLTLSRGLPRELGLPYGATGQLGVNALLPCAYPDLISAESEPKERQVTAIEYVPIPAAVVARMNL
jgi:hypothetical protein